MRKLKTIIHSKMIANYQRLIGLSISIEDCAYLEKKFQQYGVADYIVGNYQGKSFLTSYSEYFVDFVPMWEYQEKYLIPLIFRNTADSKIMFEDSQRWPAFFMLLDWYLKYQPAKVIIESNQGPKEKPLIDTAYLFFRLSEIWDSAAYPMAHLNSLPEFIRWNRRHRVIDTGRYLERTADFNDEKIEDLEQLLLLIAVVKLKYQE